MGYLRASARPGWQAQHAKSLQTRSAARQTLAACLGCAQYQPTKCSACHKEQVTASQLIALSDLALQACPGSLITGKPACTLRRAELLVGAFRAHHSEQQGA